MKVVLASKSKRREEILNEHGFTVIVDPSNFDEGSVRLDDVKQHVMELAKQKAQLVAKRHPNSIIIAADTLVYFNNKIIGQQENSEQAEKTLRLLIGKTNDVYTGICIINTANNKIALDVDKSEVTLKNISDETLHEYIKSEQYKGKAAAYNVSDKEFESFVANVHGSYTNVLGLPIDKCKDMIKEVK